MAMVPGTSVDESLRLGQKIAAELLKNEHIRSVAQRTGRAEEGDDINGVHETEFDVALKPDGEDSEVVQAQIRDTLSGFAGAGFSIDSVLSERIQEIISGITAQVVVKVYGDDLDTIDAKAEEIAKVLGTVRGAVDVQVESPPGMPQVVVKLKPDRLTQFGFQPADVLDAIETAYQGTPANQVFDADRVFDVTVILPPADRQDPEKIGSLLLRNSEGQRLPLNQLADITQETGRYVILHEDTHRRQAVTCNVSGRDVASFVAEAQRRVAAGVSFPAGVYPVFSGEAEAQALSRHEILAHSILAGAGIILLLAIVFRNARNLSLVLLNIPLSLVGGALAVFCSGGALSVGSLVGFVTLFGITTRNSIMMVSHFEHLVTLESQPWNIQTAVRGASERLVPILMTALVTGLGLLPLAIGAGSAGREIQGPMAIVILGGLATSTVLNLMVLPTLALRYGKFGSIKE
jgi:Cu/Ag efflux pump CusA